MTTYRWKPGVPISGDPVAVGRTLSKLVDQHADRLTPKVVVNEARSDRSPLHKLFDWNDASAAERFRESQARLVMRSIEVITEGREPERMFVAVVEQVGGEEQKSYVTTARVMADSELTAQILHQAMEEVEAFRRRYGKFKQLAAIADHAQQAMNTLMEQQQVPA